MKNLIITKKVNESNLINNGSFDVYDNQNTASSFQWLDFRNNYWGSEMTEWMLDNPFPMDPPEGNCSRIYDAFDNSLLDGYYVNYGGNSIFGPKPVTSPYTDAHPSAAAPAILLAVTPNLDNAANVGLAVFTLVFSETMDLTVGPAVTFGLSSPYTDHVVASQGWSSPTTWRGTFAMGIETGDGLNTLRVAAAKAADGFVIPDDTFHQFQVDTRPGTGVNNGVAVPISESALQLSWDPSDDVKLLGYAIRRSLASAGPWTNIKTLSASMTTTNDIGLTPNTTYYYQVIEYDSSFNSRQLTSPFMGTTLLPTNIKSWWDY